MTRSTHRLPAAFCLFVSLAPVLSARVPCAIVVGANASPIEKEAGSELQRYLEQLFHFRPPVAAAPVRGADSLIVVGTPDTNPAILPAGWTKLGEQEYVIRPATIGAKHSIIVGGGSPVATLWAAYELLESYGVRYLLSGDVLPPKDLHSLSPI